MDSFEPHNSLSRSRGWPATSKGNRGHQAALPIGVPWHICTPVTSWVAKEEVSSAPVCPVSDLFLPPLVLPSRFLTLLSPQPGASQAPPSPFPATTACLFPFAAKLLERPVYTCCLPSSSPISSSTHCFLTCSAPLNASNPGPLLLLHLFMSLLISTNHLPPKTALQVSPVLGTLAVTWLGQLKNRMEEAERSPRRSAALYHPAFLDDGHLASHAQPCASSLLPALGWKTPSGILRGRRDLDARLSTLRLSNRQTRMEVPL
nr:uncharacterized protein LOC112930257 isoform X2 [Vulpes vulpes]